MHGNEFWKVCEALDCEQRIELLGHLLRIEESEFPCVNELAETFKISSAAMSVHLKKLANAGLVASKRADRRVYYRAFATTADGERVIAALRAFFEKRPSKGRMDEVHVYAHALSHERRHMIVRCLNETPGRDLKELAMRTDMPTTTADRLFGELNRAHVVDRDMRVVKPTTEPETTLLALTLS